MLDRFKIVKMLGRGKFGEVFLAQHKETRALYALKKIVKEKVKEMNMINQFLEEVKLHSCLDHPNIVKFFGYFEENYHIYLIL
jgi:serine/threonine protein kinase